MTSAAADTINWESLLLD